MPKPVLLAALGTTLLALTGPAAAGDQAVDVPFEYGATLRVLMDAPAHPRAALIMLPGGTGRIGVGRDGVPRQGGNFLVRTRAGWVARGFAVVIPDSIDGGDLHGVRSASAYGRLVGDLAAYARDQMHVPVFLVGTSAGTVAAMNGAAHAAPGLIAGVVLTEAVTVAAGLNGETVFDSDPGDVRVPALIVANADDACLQSPPGMAPRIAAAMVRAPSADIVTVSGGTWTSGSACGAFSPHGYHGIERSVIDAIARWLRAHG